MKYGCLFPSSYSLSCLWLVGFICLQRPQLFCVLRTALPYVPHSNGSLLLPGLPYALRIRLSAVSVLAFPRCLCGSEPPVSARTTVSGLLFLSLPFSHLPMSGSSFLFMCHFSYHRLFSPVRGLDNSLSSVIYTSVGNCLRKQCQNKRAFKKSCCLMGFYSKMTEIGPEKRNVLPEVRWMLPRGSSTVLPFARSIG